MFQRLGRVWARMRGRVPVPSGAILGANVHLGSGVWLDPAPGRMIVLEDDVVIASGARILVHDAAANRITGLTWMAPVTVKERAFVGSNAILLPGVTVGADAVVAAGAVVTSDVPDGTVFAGVPARQIGTTGELVDGLIARDRPVFSRSTYSRASVSADLLAQLDEAAASGGFFFGPTSASNPRSLQGRDG